MRFEVRIEQFCQTDRETDIKRYGAPSRSEPKILTFFILSPSIAKFHLNKALLGLAQLNLLLKYSCKHYFHHNLGIGKYSEHKLSNLFYIHKTVYCTGKFLMSVFITN